MTVLHSVVSGSQQKGYEASFQASQLLPTGLGLGVFPPLMPFSMWITQLPAVSIYPSTTGALGQAVGHNQPLNDVPVGAYLGGPEAARRPTACQRFPGSAGIAAQCRACRVDVAEEHAVGCLAAIMRTDQDQPRVGRQGLSPVPNLRISFQPATAMRRHRLRKGPLRCFVSRSWEPAEGCLRRVSALKLSATWATFLPASMIQSPASCLKTGCAASSCHWQRKTTGPPGGSTYSSQPAQAEENTP